MPQAGSSSQIRCRCGLKAHHFTSSTPANPGRKFYKCPRPKIISCDFWEWEDKILCDSAMTEITGLTSSLDVVNIERYKLREEVISMKDMNQSEANNVGKLEERVSLLKMLIIASWALFLGFFVASVMK
uniref:GRF-type domain-containing protein n=1 Tax=Nicotiana tabacum TaxID=4097 RepID=A0A1S3XAJ9_TOBAC|nr:uncharacterized protein LOC104107933 [Nicotiana tomentosiformis]XP_016436955.1 PREDICTED: uncharacterized protein LOC107763052 [Nicotiana tabacum]